jgi:hypothetical protein
MERPGRIRPAYFSGGPGPRRDMPWPRLWSLAVAFSLYAGAIESRFQTARLIILEHASMAPADSSDVPPEQVERIANTESIRAHIYSLDRGFLLTVGELRGFTGALGVLLDLAATVIWLWVPGV